MSKKKTPSVKASSAKSAFGGVNQYNYSDTGFGSSTSQKKNGAISTTNTLNPQLDALRGQAQSGFGQALDQINMRPEDQLARVTNGQDAFYNMQSGINKQQTDLAQQAAQVRYGASGLDNSTAYGGFQGQIANESMLSDLQNRYAAIDAQRQNAMAQGAFNAQTLDQLHGYLTQPGQTSNSNIMQGFQNLDQVAMFNAQQQQQASQANAQLQQQAQAQKSSMWGNLIKAGLGAAMIPFTGGLSGLAGFGGAGAGLGALFNTSGINGVKMAAGAASKFGGSFIG